MAAEKGERMRTITKADEGKKGAAESSHARSQSPGVVK